MKPHLRKKARLAVERLENRLTPSTGQLDPTFGTGGRALPDFGGFGQINAVGVQPDGKIVVAGFVLNTNDDFAVARLTSTGQLDSTFGSGGVTVVDFGGDDFLTSLLVQSNGSIVVAGTTASGCGVVRLNSAGQLDSTFGSSGKASIDINFFGPVGLVAQSDGSYVVGGVANFRFSAARLTSAGSLDATFGTAGVFTESGGEDVQGTDVVIQPDDKVLLIGDGGRSHSICGGGTAHDFGSTRFHVWYWGSID
jgi:uncharacterized delta-60 repeat protein